MKNIYYIESKSLNPYYNLALESYLLANVPEDSCILYLWQNEKTVVIGRNQNPYKECKIGILEKDGGQFVRRLSGGGAVFHDTGNLNFTFLLEKQEYDVNKQLEVILKAVQSYNIPAEKSGRNDITVDGKKFSGNAFYEKDGKCYHHGTLLINVDKDMLSHYLNVSMDKLVSKGVDSVRSRVTNLVDYNENITIHGMKRALVNGFQEVYGLTVLEYNLHWDELKFQYYLRKFSSNEWNYGKKIESNYTITNRFSWGGVEVVFQLMGEYIKDVLVYTDALDIHIGSEVESILVGCKFSSDQIRNQYYGYLAGDEDTSSYRMDLMEYILSEVEMHGI